MLIWMLKAEMDEWWLLQQFLLACGDSSGFSAPFNNKIWFRSVANLPSRRDDKIAIPTARYLSLLCCYILQFPSRSLFLSTLFRLAKNITTLVHFPPSLPPPPPTIIINGIEDDVVRCG